MLEFIKKMLREHLVLSVLILVLAPFTTLSLASLFFASDREIVYTMNKVFANCGLSGIPERDCVALYEIIIGNTGMQDETVRLVWDFDLSAWERGQQILNISADRPRGHDPVLACKTSEFHSECGMEKFAPGALVIMKITCLACSSQTIGRMEDKPVAVQTAAHMARGDPRVTIVFRRLQNLMNLFI